MIEAAYEVFIQGATEKELRSYIFELQTKAMLNLEMSRMKDYLKIIAEKDGIHVCSDAAQYVFVVLAQFLQIVVPTTHSIHNRY